MGSGRREEEEKEQGEMRRTGRRGKRRRRGGRRRRDEEGRRKQVVFRLVKRVVNCRPIVASRLFEEAAGKAFPSGQQRHGTARGLSVLVAKGRAGEEGFRALGKSREPLHKFGGM